MKLSLQTVVLTYLTFIAMAAAIPTPQADDFQLDTRDNFLEVDTPQVRAVAEETTLVEREPFLGGIFRAVKGIFRGGSGGNSQ